MEKSFLEQKIHERAVERFDKEWREFVRQAYDMFGDNLRIDLPMDKGVAPVFNLGSNYGIFSNSQENNNLNMFTNYDDVKAVKVANYEKEETNKILDQLGNLGYLYGNE